MAAIYDKALKRVDLSGVVQAKDEKEDEKGKGKVKGAAGKEKGKDANDSKAGADAGKIVNLMAADSNRVSRVSAAMMRGMSWYILTDIVMLPCRLR